jgi:very-short-patch-repair endonuclease
LTDRFGCQYRTQKEKKKKAGKEFLWQLVKASRMNVIKKNQQMRFFGYIIGVDVRKVKTIPIIPRLFVRTIWNDCLD